MKALVTFDDAMNDFEIDQWAGDLKQNPGVKSIYLIKSCTSTCLGCTTVEGSVKSTRKHELSQKELKARILWFRVKPILTWIFAILLSLSLVSYILFRVTGNI
jgi:hypothetical protein